MQHPDEGTIHAWLDGALPDEEARAVADHVASCAACGERVAEARGLMAGASRILNALDDVPSGVVPGRAMHPGRARRTPWWRRPAMGIAAAIMVVAFGTTMVVTRNWQGTSIPASETIATTVFLGDSQASVAAESAVAAPDERAPATAPTIEAEALPPAAPAPAQRMALRQADSEAQALAAPPAGRVADQPERRLAEQDEAVARKALVDSIARRHTGERTDSLAVARVESLALRTRTRSELSAAVIEPAPARSGAPAVVGGQTLTRTAESLAGCYALELREAGGQTTIDLPGTVELAASARDAAEAANRARRGFAPASRPFMVPPAMDSGQLGWRLASDDTVFVRLPAGNSPVVLTFPAEVTQPQLGLAMTQALPGITPVSAPVLVRRVPCP